MESSVAVTHLSKTYELVATGWLSGWLGVLVFLLVGGLVGHHLYVEMRRLRGMTARARRVLGVRLLIVGLVVWLLCQPLLIVKSRWETLPRALVLASHSPSMKVREEFGYLYQKIDALEVLEQNPTENRNRGAAELVRCLAGLRTTLEDAGEMLQKEWDRTADGFPIRPDFGQRMDRLAEDLRSARKGLWGMPARLAGAPENEKTGQDKAAILLRVQVLSSTCQELAQEIPLTVAEAARHPELLQKFLARVRDARDSIDSAIPVCHALQNALDEALVPVATLGQYRNRPVVREALAGMAVHLIRARAGKSLDIVHQTPPSLSSGLEVAMSQRSTHPLACLVVLDDGSMDLGDADRDLLRTLAEAEVRTHAVLVGADGVEPEDAGLIALEIPGVGVAGKKVPMRARVKARLGEGKTCRIVAREGTTILADVPAASADSSVVPLSLNFDSPGWKQVIVEVRPTAADVFPGNERAVAMVDIFANRPRVLIVSDGLRRDLALYRGVAEGLPWLAPAVIQAAPGIQKTAVGSEPNEFPANADQWKNVQLLVLLGRVPEGLSEEVLQALRTAVRSGLHVLVQAPDSETADGDREAWTSFFGLAGGSVGLPRRLSPRSDLWLPLYELGQDEPQSLEQWRLIPEVRGLRAPARPGIPLLAGEQESPIQIFLQDQGLIIHQGVPALSALRQGGHAESVNRLVASLLELGVQRWTPSTPGPVLFPPQPIFGKDLIVAGQGDAVVPMAGAERRTGPAGEIGLRITGEDEVVLRTDAETRHIAVHRLLRPSDFRLAARSGPLREVAAIGGGRYADLADLPELIAGMQASPASQSKNDVYRLWTGIWPLVLLLILVSAEYLLRRRAGRPL